MNKTINTDVQQVLPSNSKNQYDINNENNSPLLALALRG
jgi:hypothetical protein